jgi:hypothetical protein
MAFLRRALEAGNHMAAGNQKRRQEVTRALDPHNESEVKIIQVIKGLENSGVKDKL